MPDTSPANARPIEFLTENGFSIVRLWEIDREPPPTAGNYHFMVRNPQGLEREIAVAVADDLVVQIELHSRRRILPGSSFWICCAERHLAIYLWEKNKYPPGDKLCVSQLDPEDLMSALRWGTN